MLHVDSHRGPNAAHHIGQYIPKVNSEYVPRIGGHAATVASYDCALRTESSWLLLMLLLEEAFRMNNLRKPMLALAQTQAQAQGG